MCFLVSLIPTQLPVQLELESRERSYVRLKEVSLDTISRVIRLFSPQSSSFSLFGPLPSFPFLSQTFISRKPRKLLFENLECVPFCSTSLSKWMILEY